MLPFILCAHSYNIQNLVKLESLIFCVITCEKKQKKRRVLFHGECG